MFNAIQLYECQGYFMGFIDLKTDFIWLKGMKLYYRLFLRSFSLE